MGRWVVARAMAVRPTEPPSRRDSGQPGVPPQPAGQLTAQHLVLMAQHKQLGVLGQVSPDQYRQQAAQAPHQPIDDLQQHPEMVPATPLIPQSQKPQLTARGGVSERDRVVGDVR
jgi:hypothetical protein